MKHFKIAYHKTMLIVLFSIIIISQGLCNDETNRLPSEKLQDAPSLSHTTHRSNLVGSTSAVGSEPGISSTYDVTDTCPLPWRHAHLLGITRKCAGICFLVQ